MRITRRKLVILLPAIFILFVLFVLVGDVVTIQLRLSRNGAIAKELVAGLHADFPGVHFGGTPNYEREVIYIWISDGHDKIDRKDLARWLREKRTQDNIRPIISVRFANEVDEQPLEIGP